jgi:hypothetical protein
MDPDPGVQKTYGSGSATLVWTMVNHVLKAFNVFIVETLCKIYPPLNFKL